MKLAMKRRPGKTKKAQGRSDHARMLVTCMSSQPPGPVALIHWYHPSKSCTRMLLGSNMCGLKMDGARIHDRMANPIPTQ